MTLTYTEHGQGEVLVLLHGFCEDKSIWNAFTSELSKDYKLLAIDLPGFGETKPVKDITIEAAAEEVNNTLEMLKIDQCIMIGHSLGGYVTLAFAEQYASKLKGIGLFHSSAMEDTPEKKETRNKTAEFIKRNGLKLFSQSFVEPLFYPKYRKQHIDAIDALKNKVANCAQDTVIAYTYAMRDRVPRLSVLKKLEIPVMYIIGKDDNAVPLESSLAQCYLPKESVVHFLGETAHMGMIERKIETLKFIQLFSNYCS